MGNPTEFVKEKKYKLSQGSLKDLILNKKDFSMTILYANILLAVVAFFVLNISKEIESANMIITVVIANLAVVIGSSFASIDKKELKEALVKNNKSSEYSWNLGYEVKEFMGSGLESLVEENLTGKYALIDNEIEKRMGGVIGTTGSGKTFQLNGVFEQKISAGGGALVIDGKGTVDQLKTMYAIVGKYDRLDELYVLNFANLNNTNSIGFLNSGNALILSEILSELIEKSDPQWDSVAIDVMSNILKLLVYKRDHEGLILSFSVIGEYLSMSRLASEAILYKDKVDDVFIRDFVNYVCVNTNCDYDKFVTGKTREINTELMKASNNTKVQGVYNFTTASSKWNQILTVFGSNYYNIFGSPHPDIELLDAIQNNNIIIVVLPTSESEATAKKIGKMFLGIIKSAANTKIKKSIEPKIPFTIFLDEYPNYGTVGFARFISKSRAIGLPCWFYFQSIAQLDSIDNGKGIETKELLDNIGTFIIMKNNDAELVKKLNERVPVVVELERYMTIRRTGASADDLNAEKSLNKEKRDAFRSELFNGLSDGEAVIFLGNNYYKVVVKAHDDFTLVYDKLNLEPYFDLPKTFPKSELKIRHFLQRKEYLLASEKKKKLFKDSFF